MENKLLFCYGSLKRGFHLHHLLGRSPTLVSYEWVRGELYMVGYAYPGLIVGGLWPERIGGEVYSVTPKVYDTIKRIEEASGYKMRRVPLTNDAGVYTAIYTRPVDDLVRIAKYDLPTIEVFFPNYRHDYHLK